MTSNRTVPLLATTCFLLRAMCSLRGSAVPGLGLGGGLRLRQRLAVARGPALCDLLLAALELLLLLLLLGARALVALLAVVGLEGHHASSLAGRRDEKGHRPPGAPSSVGEGPAGQTAFRFSAEVLPRLGSRCSS